MFESDLKGFTEWLARQGADVLAPTNPYEVARFRAQGAVHVIYKDKDGWITATGFSRKCLEHFKRNQNLAMGFTGRRKTLNGKIKAALVARDGSLCFFCAKPVPEAEMSVEHLVGLGKGGPNHMDNFALAHESCNKKADNLPLIEKIKIYVRARNHPIFKATADSNGKLVDVEVVQNLGGIPD